MPPRARLLEDQSLRRVAVLRALQLGDLLCAVPALRALRRALPDATIALIGLPWAAAFVDRFAAYVDEFIEFPGYPGLPERAVEPRRLTRFISDMRARRLDLAIQLHGSGSFVNDCVALFRARRSAGFYEPGDSVPDLAGFMRWPAGGTETERLLGLIHFLGAPTATDTLEFPLNDRDRSDLSAALARVPGASTLSERPYVCVHAGARYPSRRWLPERFAAVADGLAARGLTVCITGTADERAITSAVIDRMRTVPVDLTGRLSLGAFAALVSGATLVVANDTGISHIAAAVGTRSVIIASGSDVRRWAPRDTGRHHVLWKDLACRPCMHRTCPIGHPCATSVGADAALGAADALLSEALAMRGPVHVA
jgi:ADP-heptose:LPS heptosyltransferase